MYAFALRSTPAGEAIALLLGLNILFVTLGSSMFFNERLSGFGIIGVFIIITGIAITELYS